ncbi:fibronectin, partial [Oryzias melastigma]|uniref:fibronectin n=1 Tax=Oryzias melastigma TaxID=30732 RepID=UPI00168CBE50
MDSDCYHYNYYSSVLARLCYGDYYVYKLSTLPVCGYSYCPVPPHGFRSSGQNETSITLLWNPVNNNVSFVLQFNGTETNISAPAGSEPVTYTVSSLTPATKYTFTLFSVIENIRSSEISIDAVTAPQNVDNFNLIGRNDTSMTLQWTKTKGTGYFLQYNQQWKTIPASDEEGPVTFTVSSLNPATEYMCTLYSVFENARSSKGVQLRVFTDYWRYSCGQGSCPTDHVCININGTYQCLDGCNHYTALSDDWLSEYNINGISLCNGNNYPSNWYRMFVGKSSAQIPETCVRDSRCSSYRIWATTPHPVHYNESATLTTYTARDSNCYYDTYYYSNRVMARLCYGDYYVYRLPRLPGCEYSYCAVPPHGFRSSGQNETSITLRWDKVNNSVSFVLLFNGTETNISAPAGSEPVTYTVSSLSPATKYTFTLFSVFENVRSSGISIDGVTAPQRVETFNVVENTDRSVTLQWSKVNFASYVLQYNQGWKNVSASDGDGLITYTVPSLRANTEYTFILFCVFENARSSGVQLQALTDPPYFSCGQTFCPPDQDCVFINGTAQCGEACEHYTELNDNWLSEYNINGNSYCNGNYDSPKGWYRMFVGQTSAQIPETCVQDSRCGSYDHLKMTQPHPTQYNQTVTRYLCYTYGSNCYCYSSQSVTVKLCLGDFYVYKLQRLPGCYTAYCAVPNHSFRAAGQDETSITLRWDKVNNSVSFVLLFNGTETNISAPAADDSVTYTVSSLTAATKYTFTLFSVFENVTSSGISIDAVTAPPNVKTFSLLGTSFNSITLQWSKVTNATYVLQYNNERRIIPASDADGPVTYTVSSLSAGTSYAFTLYSVFENSRGSNMQLQAVTDQYLSCGQTFCPPDQDCVIINGTAQCGEACEHYTELNDNWLSEYNINGNSYCNGNYYSPEGWYRMFVGQTSAQIPETCVQDSRCSSYRLRMTQPHPTQYNQTVTRSLCQSYYSSCCSNISYIYNNIKVKL